MNKHLKSFLLKIGVLLIVMGVVLVLNHYIFKIKPKDITDWVNGFGVWAPVVVLCIFTIRPFTLIPLSVVAVATGLLFGPYIGTAYIIIGTVLGAISSFVAIKYMITDAEIQDDDKENLKALKQNLEEHGFKSVLMLRLIPVLNFDLLTFICAKTKVDFWKYVGATAIGTIPGSSMFGFFGSSLLGLKLVNVIVLAGVVGLLFVIGFILKRHVENQFDIEELKKEIKDVKNGR